jgi:group II intron reverse transcriptase/maturase
LGIAALEDKILQQAVGTVLQQIYEQDFLGFSYGFRPGRHQHQALDALWVGLSDRKVKWVLDADIRGFFDTIDHEWMLRFIEHRIADPRILRLIRKWLKAGVSEDGKWIETAVGTPQGAVISPLLANVYLHYVFDLWANRWRRNCGTGEIIIVRYADDFVLGFQRRRDAERFLDDLKERLTQFGLAVHPEKTRLIEFGRFAADNRAQRGEGKPETFDFLGLTHICGRSRRTKEFVVLRHTAAKRMRARLQGIRDALMLRRHQPLHELGRWLASVLRGYYQYHAVPSNYAKLRAFRRLVVRCWYQALRRRGQRRRLTWERFGPLADRLLPTPRILHPYPTVRFYAKYPR